MKSISVLFSNIYNKKIILLFLIFLTSLLVSSIFLLFFRNVGPVEHHLPGTDYLEIYKPTAESILAGRGFTIEGKLSIRVPPGYPFILAMIFSLSQIIGISEIALITIFNVIVVAITCIFLFLIAELIFNKRVALISSFLWMSYPFNLWFIKNPNTEVPFILFLYAGIWLYIFSLKKRHLGFIFLAGILIGLASLIRPISFLLPLLFFLLVFLLLKDNPKKIQFSLAAILLIGSFITILPWEGYVFSKTGRILPLSSSGPGAISGGLTFALLRPEGGKVDIPSDVLVMMKTIQAEDLNSVTEIFRFCIKELIDEPLTFLKLITIKMMRAFYATSNKWYEGYILIIQLLYLTLAFWGIILGIKKFRDKIPNITFLLSIIFYFWVMTIFVLSILRYMVPAMGIIMIFSAISLESLIVVLFKKFVLKHAD